MEPKQDISFWSLRKSQVLSFLRGQVGLSFLRTCDNQTPKQFLLTFSYRLLVRSSVIQNECCAFYVGDDFRWSPNHLSSSSVWKLAKATLAGYDRSLYCLVFLISNCFYSSFGCICGKF